MEGSPPQDLTREDLEAESQDNYAFLNHSTETLYHNLPPSVDDKPLARQKRKRTSPEDQAVLEAAYKRDPKPDKTARLELVEQVALGEKEVQIWFQNRRQSSRRKSRPLLPHEIARYSFARAEALENGLLPSQAFPTEFESSSSPSTLQTSTVRPRTTPSHVQPLPGTRPRPAGRLLNSPSDEIHDSDRIASSPTPSQGGALAMTSHGMVTDEPDATYRAMARSEAPAATQSPLHHDSFESQALLEEKSHVPLKKASSFVRLAMTADGNAQVTTKDASSPSPPRPLQSAPWSDPTPISSFSRKLSRSASGRSRDSRSWEFWCDKEARSELEFKAERDASGSAAGAIGLLRSASGRSILSSLPSKRNAVFSKQGSSVKRPRLGAENPAFRRSNTSFGRLQSKPRRPNTLFQPRLGPSKSAATALIPGNESDKENWSPDREMLTNCDPKDPGNKHRSQGEDTGEMIRKPIPSVRRRTSAPREASRGLKPGGDNDPEDDAELAAFMHADLHSSSPSVEDDLDCVQGLLSLSQGNWR